MRSRNEKDDYSLVLIDMFILTCIGLMIVFCLYKYDGGEKGILS